MRKNPHADACVAGREAERNQLTCAALNIFRGSTIVQIYKRACTLEKIAVQFKPEFGLFLRAVNDKNPGIVIRKPVVGFIVDKVWAFQNHVVKLASKRAPQLVHKILGFAGVCGPHDQGIKRNVVWVHVFYHCTDLSCLSIMFI